MAEDARLLEVIHSRTREIDEPRRDKLAVRSSISLELRTPSNAMFGYSGMLSPAVFGALND